MLIHFSILNCNFFYYGFYRIYLIMRASLAQVFVAFHMGSFKNIWEITQV